MNSHKSIPIARWIAIFLAVLVTTLGVVVIIGWYTENMSLLRVIPNAVAMQYNTALGFILSGLGLLMFLFKQKKISIVLGSLVFILGFLTALEYLLGVNFDIDELFMEHYISDQVTYKGRMAPNTAICFTLTGLLLIVHYQRKLVRNAVRIIGILGVMIFILGSLALLGYFVELHAVYTWGELTKMAIHTTVGFIMVGISALFGIWYPNGGKYWVESSITRRLTIYLLVPILFLYLIIATYSIYMVQESTYQEAHLKLMEVGWKHTSRIDKRLSQFEEVARSSTRFVATQKELSEDEITSFLTSNLDVDPAIYGAALVFAPHVYENKALFAPYVFKKDGIVKFIDFGVEGYNYTQDQVEWYQIPKNENKELWTEPYPDNNINNTIMSTFSVPMRKNDTFFGVATVDIPLYNIKEVLESEGLDNFAFGVLSKEGNYIYTSYDESLIGKNVYDENNSRSIRKDDRLKMADAMLSGSSGSMSVDMVGGDAFHAVFNPIGTTGWTFYVGTNRSAIFRPVGVVIYKMAYIFVFILFLFVFIIYYVSRQLSKRIVQLSLATTKIASGDQPELKKLYSNDEIGVLSQNFSRMSKELSEREKDLKLLNEQLEEKVNSRTTELVNANEEINKANDELSKNMDELTDLVTALPIATVLFKSDGQIQILNQKFTDLLGFNVDDLPSLDVQWEFFYPVKEYRNKIYQQFLDDIEFTKKTGKPAEAREVLVMDKFEKEHIVELHHQNVGELSLFMLVDINDRKKLEHSLREAKVMADEANRSKSAFLANMSHEIRTPMNAVLGFSELLQKMVKSEVGKSYLNSIISSGKNLLALINDILDLSKIEAGKIDVNYSYFNIRLVLEEMQRVFSLKVKEKGLSFIVEVDPHIPQFVNLDEVRFRQILINLISNAIKFTDEGFVKVLVQVNEIYQNEEKVDFTISVEDSGIGIKEEFRVNLFQSFTQQDGSINKRFGGTGLGLSISKNLAELMDGDIVVTSEEGKGATFSWVLQNTSYDTNSEVNEAQQKINFDALEFNHSVVLIVDDIEDNRKYLKGALLQFDFELIEAKDGVEALEILNDASSEIDAIITDLSMPNMDGFEMVKKIRQIKRFKQIPIIATSASVMEFNTAKAKEFEFQDFLAKPVGLNDLYSSLVKYIPSNFEELNVEDTEQPTSGKLQYDIKVSASELIPVIDELEEEQKSLKEKQSMSDIEAFSEKLIKIGNKMELQGFVDYGNELKAAVESFNVEKMLSLINGFDAHIVAIRTALKE